MAQGFVGPNSQGSPMNIVGASHGNQVNDQPQGNHNQN